MIKVLFEQFSDALKWRCVPTKLNHAGYNQRIIQIATKYNKQGGTAQTVSVNGSQVGVRIATIINIATIT
jgi:hypothetical protein